MLFKRKKRIFAKIDSCINKAIALILIIIISPVFLIISCACLYKQGFPLFYKSKRIGKNGNDFTLYKFRSMKQGTSDDQERIETPKKAISMGADYLVIGRPITKSKH